MRDIMLLGAARTPIGSLNGIFAQTDAISLGKTVSEAVFERSSVTTEQVEEVIFGNVLSAGLGQNPARQIALGIGVPQERPAFTVNKVCGSGLKAIELAWQSIALERNAVVLAGGTENMSRAPYLLPAMRSGARLGHTEAVDAMVHDGLWDAIHGYHMGITAENIAEEFNISREEQDLFALASQQKYEAAHQAQHFDAEIVPVTVQNRRNTLTHTVDEHPKPNTSLEKMEALRPAFKADGTVTAANASGINDGAAAMIVAAKEGLPTPIPKESAVYLRDVRSWGCDPAMMGLGPIGVVKRLLQENNLTHEDIGVWELNEAFAAQSIAVIRELGINIDKVNPSGGAIALGHPIGCTGARITTTLIYSMKRLQCRYGIAAMCIGGGQGIGCLLENYDNS